MNTEKTVGYSLLLVGIVAIIFSVVSIYLVFTGKKQAPQVFNFESPSFSLPSANITTPQLDLSQIEIPGIDLEQLMPETPQKEEGEESTTQEVKFIPDELLNTMVNISIFLMLMSFISGSGTKIASLGIKLVKELPTPKTKS